MTFKIQVDFIIMKLFTWFQKIQLLQALLSEISNTWSFGNCKQDFEWR